MNRELSLPTLRSPSGGGRLTRQAARLQRRRLVRQGRLAAQQGELHLMQALLDDAVTVVASGWVQHGWFLVTGEHGERVRVGPHAVRVGSTRTVTGACLVGGIVHAAGGPAAAGSQLVQRTLDLTWHVLYNGESRPPRWCPAPALRAAHLRDLTRWNDEPARTSPEVAALLHSVARAARAQSERLRAESLLLSADADRAPA